MSDFYCFLEPNALAINRARQDHLDSLALDLSGKTVIEVGAGIGLHTQFFLDRGCQVKITDGSPTNLGEIKRRHPTLDSCLLDLEKEESLRALGEFDIIYCYGLLYHMSDPDRVLHRLSEICREKILLELICAPTQEDKVIYTTDSPGLNQSTIGKACRPSRRWILNKLNQYFGYGYITVTQPNHREFPTDWTKPTHQNTRAVFVGSRHHLDNPLLITEPLQHQKYTQE